MMFFVYHLQTYSPKNRAWKKVIDYVEKYKNVRKLPVKYVLQNTKK